jgi:hypothetical protein
MISIDFDNTITHIPEFFKDFTKNKDCIIISSRDNTKENIEEVINYLEENEILVNGINLCGGFNKKLERIKLLKPKYHIDDYLDVANFIREYLWDTIPIWIGHW